MPLHVQQTNFTAGELSPRLRGRIDLQKYSNGCQTLENFLIFPHGGITRRPGTRFIAAAKYADRPCRLLPFQFSTVQAYQLEVGDGYVRFFKDQAQIWSPATDAAITNGTFGSNITGWTDASGAGSSVSWDAAGAMDLTSNGTTSAVARQQVTHTSDEVLHVLSFEVLEGPVTAQVGTTAGGSDILAAEEFNEGWHCREFTPPASNAAFWVEFSNDVSGAATVDNVALLDDVAVEIGAPFAHADLREIAVTQSADIMFFTHEDYSPHRLERHGHASWSLVPLTFGSAVATPTGAAAVLTGTGTGRTWSYVVTAEINGVESAPTSPVSVTGPAALDNTNYVTVSWNTVTGAERYNVYRALNGVYYYIGQAYSSTAPTLVDNGIVSDTASSAPIVQNPFDADGNPAACIFHEQRMFFGRSILKPQTVWGSKTGDFYNFSKCIPLKDDDRLIFTLDDSQVNAIQWLMADRYLYIGTTSGEYILSSSTGTGAITPTDFLCRRSTGYGSARIMPVQLGSVVIFVQNGGTCIRELSYRWESDSLTAPDLTVMAEHLFKESPVVEMALTKLPDPHLYVVRADGQLAVLAYLKEHEVVGWSRLITDGEFESVSTITGADRDEVWVSVKREIGGANVRYIELFEAQFTADTAADAFFVDSGLSYSGASTSTLSGLDHLEGKEVQILSDGAVISPQTVSSGSISLPRAVTQAHVGLAFTSTMSPVEVEIPSNTGTSHGRVQRISRVMARVYKTLGLKFGASLDDLIEKPFRDSSMDMGAAVSLFSGDVELSWDGSNDRENRIYIVQDQPLPMTILALFVEATVYDR